MQLRKVGADIGVDRHYIPGRDHEVVEVGKGSAHDVVEELDLDLAGDSIECGGLCVLWDGVETNLLTRVGGVLDDGIAGVALL